MRAIEAAPLASAMVLAGCLETHAVYCPETGYYCPASQACAKGPLWCGPPEQVAKCLKSDGEWVEEWTPCTYEDQGDDFPIIHGSCRAGVCEPCTSDRTGCPPSGWQSMTVPVDVDLRSVWVAGLGDVYAGGEGGTLLHYDGRYWTQVVTMPAIPANVRLDSMWGTGPNDIYIVTNDPDRNLLHIVDRTQLSIVTLPPEARPLRAISGTLGGDTFAVGLLGTILRLTAGQWQLASSGQGPSFYGVSVGAAGDVVAVGDQGWIAIRNASGWTINQPLSPPTYANAELMGVQLNAADDIVVVGSLADPVPDPSQQACSLFRFDGTSWRSVGPVSAAELPTCPSQNLKAVWSIGSISYVVGERGTLLRSLDGQSWSIVPPLGSNDLFDVDGTSSTNVFVVGALGAIWRYTGD